MPIQSPAARPCGTCPYRRDCPSGIWTGETYGRLVLYDLPTALQPNRVFLCHLQDTATGRRVCGGWAGTHDTEQLLGLRYAVIDGDMTAETLQAILVYRSPVPLFESGKAAYEHGIRDINNPSPEAQAAISRIERTRTDLIYLDGPERTSTR
ncbi:hypothetical protein DMB66_59140 [Actinoplanes sp. ATCC 53533]|nr:DUF6283 family protein [Actinoplanes sp. ATCC 53533]RSM38180.1 hypothetical protein DMB66_59140 [Actinoplanes sp. ATCC 53533]